MKEINIYFSKENNAMKKLIFKILPAAILLVGAFIVLGGCEEKEQIKLKGTSWKLKGIYNNNTKEFKVLAPENCNDCYSFTFDTDTTAKGKSTTNQVGVYLCERVSIGIETFVGEIGDGYVFVEATDKVTSCSVSDQYLKFFFDEGNQYLLFKRK